MMRLLKQHCVQPLSQCSFRPEYRCESNSFHPHPVRSGPGVVPKLVRLPDNFPNRQPNPSRPRASY